jgi:hypothetical protein
MTAKRDTCVVVTPPGAEARFNLTIMEEHGMNVLVDFIPIGFFAVVATWLHLSERRGRARVAPPAPPAPVKAPDPGSSIADLPSWVMPAIGALYVGVGIILGWLAFFAAWIGFTLHYGLLGFVLGWIPAWIIGLMAGWLWPAIAALTVWLVQTLA